MRQLLGLLLPLLISASVEAEPLRLALDWKPGAEFGGFYAAQELGYFKEGGLEVEILEGGSSKPNPQMVSAGEVEYALSTADQVAIAHDRGMRDIVALFATFQTNPQGMMSHAARGFTSVEEVLRSDGVLLWQSGMPYTLFLTKKYGPVKPTVAPYLGGIGDFEHDAMLSQQCYVTDEPILAKAVGLKIDTFLIADTGFNPYSTMLITSRQRLESAPQEVKAMVAAVRKGWQSYLDDPVATNKAMAKLNPAISMQILAASTAAQTPFIQMSDDQPLGNMTASRWETLVAQLLEVGAISKTIDTEQLFVSQ
ncbi:MAG: ABC transporter substrate-binding protein [Pseudomonadota bacterium]